MISCSGFIKANTKLVSVPAAQNIQLHLADEIMPLWQKTEEELGALGLPPPFWAFAWAGGQALARYLIENSHKTNGKRVLDFASGSGIVAIAAGLAGAEYIIASDIDSFAHAAIEINADVNGVEIDIWKHDILGQFDFGYPIDLVVAGDQIDAR